MATAASRSRLVVLDVGHGNSAVAIPGKNSGAVIIDTGSGSALLEFLTENNIKRIACVYISHADSDHIGGLIGLLSSKEVTIDRVVLNSDGLKKSEIWNDLRYELNSAHNSNQLRLEISLTKGTQHQYDDITVDVQGPSHYLASGGPGSKDRNGRVITTNSVSAIIKLSVVKNRSVLLSGDLDRVGLDDAIGNAANLDCDVLVFPHHGGLPGSCDVNKYVEDLISATKPEVVIFSNGRGRYNNPRSEIVDAVRSSVGSPHISCTQLSENCNRLNAPSDTHLVNVFSAGRAKKKCCAGSIVIPLHAPIKMFPAIEKHKDFIRMHVENPMCCRNESAPD